VVPNDKVFGSVQVGNTMGGVNCPAVQPRNRIFYTQANNSSIGTESSRIFEKMPEANPDHIAIWEVAGFAQPGFSRRLDVIPRTGPGRRRRWRRRRQPHDHGPWRAAIVKPPYGVITALDMNSGTLKWQVPHGDTPDAVRNSPLLKGMNIPKTGQTGIVGVVLTKSLVIAGDPQVTASPDRPRGAMLRAYDQQTGKEVGAVWMPAQQSGNPMTYMVDGRQYIIVAIGGGIYSSEYIAFALPQSELRKTTR
jgi:hypothetical protein